MKRDNSIGGPKLDFFLFGGARYLHRSGMADSENFWNPRNFLCQPHYITFIAINAVYLYLTPISPLDFVLGNAAILGGLHMLKSGINDFLEFRGMPDFHYDTNPQGTKIITQDSRIKTYFSEEKKRISGSGLVPIAFGIFLVGKIPGITLEAFCGLIYIGKAACYYRVKQVENGRWNVHYGPTPEQPREEKFALAPSMS